MCPRSISEVSRSVRSRVGVDFCCFATYNCVELFLFGMNKQQNLIEVGQRRSSIRNLLKSNPQLFRVPPPPKRRNISDTRIFRMHFSQQHVTVCVHEFQTFSPKLHGSWQWGQMLTCVDSRGYFFPYSTSAYCKDLCEVEQGLDPGLIWRKRFVSVWKTRMGRIHDV